MLGGKSNEAAPNTESYDATSEQGFLSVSRQPLSTFSIDVDTASYANVRRFLTMGQLPPADAVRIEELINYFPYQDAPPTNEEPFAVHAETAGCPWQPDHRLVRVSLKGKTVDTQQRGLSNLVFLIDVSGSMGQENKLPLVQASLRMLVDQLGENDRVAMVVYAGNSGLVLPSTTGDQKETIRTAIDRLQAGGSTNGGAGIELAYKVAKEHLIPGGVNRVILCTDGDFNVGIVDRGQLIQFVQEQAKSNVFLSVLGFGMGNLKDSMMEQLADKGNGNYAYIDSQREARKVFVEQMTGTLMTIAKDVKIQIEFNPNTVAAYRLIGYENRLLAAQDFRDDTKDAGEIGAGHTVTALYELIPAGKGTEITPVAASAIPLRYQQTVTTATDAANNELLTLMLRYKQPEGVESKEIQFSLVDMQAEFAGASADFRFSAAVAAFGMLLRNSQWKGTATWSGIEDWATLAVGDDPQGHRGEFLTLVKRAKELAQN